MKNQLLSGKPCRLFILICLLFLSCRSNATNYYFLGTYSNSWFNGANWFGVKPPATIPAGDFVYITAPCYIDQPITCNGTITYTGFPTVWVYNALTIGAGGAFNVANLINYGDIMLNGSMSVAGNFNNLGYITINSSPTLTCPIYNSSRININASGQLTVAGPGSLQNYSLGTVNVYGQLTFSPAPCVNSGAFIVYGTGTINCVSGALFQNFSTLQLLGVLNIGSGSTFENTVPGYLNNSNGGVLKGSGTFRNDGAYGGASGSTVTPGSSTTGMLTVSGSNGLSAMLFTTYLCDINGTMSGVNADRLAINNGVSLASASLIVNWGSFVPLAGQSFTILTCSNHSGQFATVNIPPIAGRAFSVVYNPTSVVITVSAVLPLRLLSFSGNIVQNSEVKLHWQTADEINVSGYEIESSADGINFTKIGFVASKNSNYTENYNYLLTQNNERVYYRLKMVDTDGRFAYSNIITLSNKRHKKLLFLYPNPVVHTLYIENNGELKPASAEIIDASGKTVLTQQYGSSSKKSIDVSNLVQGIYTIRLINNDKMISTEKFIKQ